MEIPKVLLDTDVVVNWLVQELETQSGKELWKAPHEIVQRAENKVEEDLAEITSVIDVLIPDEISLFKANTLQAEYLLDPFDAIHLSLCMGLEPMTLVSRDSAFISVSKKLVLAQTPEEFIGSL